MNSPDSNILNVTDDVFNVVEFPFKGQRVKSRAIPADSAVRSSDWGSLV